MRRRLARVLTDIDTGAIELDKGRALIYGLSHAAAIAKWERELSIEERLAALEERLEANR